MLSKRMQLDTDLRTKETHMTLAALPDLIKVPAVAEYLGVSRAQAWRLVWSGELPSVRLSERVVRIERQQLERWLAGKGLAARAS
jgi:excisionase family DNA binding protein